MITDIRKLSVGRDFPDGAIHYQVGKNVNLQGIPYVVSKIAVNQELKFQGKTAYDIFLTNEEGTVLWKTVVDMPVLVENNINFE
jgi:hypothetical protein